jgi:hypothetical protein
MPFKKATGAADCGSVKVVLAEMICYRLTSDIHD